jgi:peptide/nickel transport system substrate-binding protein
VRFRQACARAINRSDIVQRLTKGNAVIGSAGYLPPTNEYYVPVEQYPFDPEAANRMLDDAGYRRSGPGGVRQGPDGKPLRYTLTVVSGIPAVLELVTRDLKNVGVELTPKQVPLISLLGALDYEIAIGFDGGVTTGADPDHLRLVYSSKSGAFQHPPGYANPKVDDLAERQVVTLDDAERKRLVGELQRLVAQDIPVLPLYYPTEYSIFKRSTFDQWSESTAVTEQKRNLMTGLKSGLKIRPGTG